MRKDFEGPHGDRRQELVFIGTDLKMPTIEAALNKCLCTPSEWGEVRTAPVSVLLSPATTIELQPWMYWLHCVLHSGAFQARKLDQMMHMSFAAAVDTCKNT